MCLSSLIRRVFLMLKRFDSGVGVYFESLLPMGDLLKFGLLLSHPPVNYILDKIESFLESQAFLVGPKWDT